ncbi:MAG TPA: DUF72 domain-containing protein [Nannocystaceae bacterium]|nr:DUF72 domain-containing protein [Nannocystaceae bacterium]
MPRTGDFRVGTSGWVYDDWPGRFYPEKLPREQWFAHYASEFDTVEVNNSFYRLPQARTFAAWAEQAPPGFTFAVKFSRFGSHLKRLRDPEGTIGLFLARAEQLGDSFGPILVQLPPRWGVNVERLQDFLQVAPKTHRWAVEVRDDSWLCDPVYRVLERHGAALVIHDLVPRHPRVVTADWTYLRFHGIDYGGHYSDRSLRTAAKRIADWRSSGLDVFAYFNNDKLACGVRDAAVLRSYVLGSKRRKRQPSKA